MKKIISIIIVSLLFSCANQSNNTGIYHYGIYNDANEIKGYVKRIVHYDGKKRINTVKRYDKRKILQNKSIEFFELYADNVLKSVNKQDYYKISKKDTCYSYTSSTNDEFKSCYLRKVNLTVDGVRYKKASKFLVSKQVVDGISNYKIFDENFILIRQEYDSGFLDYYRIDRIQKVDDL